MKNNIFISLAFLILFITSCTKTSVAPDVNLLAFEDTVSTRSSVNVTATVSEIIITDGVMELTGIDTDLTGLTIASVQNLKFTDVTNSTVSVPVSITSFEIIITDGVMEFTAPGVNFDGLEIASNQILVFN